MRTTVTVNDVTYNIELNGEGDVDIYDDNWAKVDILDCYDLLVDYEKQVEERVVECIKQNEHSYKYEMLNSDGQFVPKEA